MSDIPHIIQSYDNELVELNTLIAKMGNRSVGMVNQAIESLVTSNTILAQDVISQDKQVNESLNDATKQAQSILALRSPIANDLRFVLTALQVSLNLERVGDLSKNIAKLVVKSSLFVPEVYQSDLQKMSQLASDNLSKCLNCYNLSDDKGAVSAYLEDKKLDKLHRQFSASVLERMRQGTGDVDSSVNLLFVSRHLERIGDHGKNIAEATMFKVTGEVGDIEDLDHRN